MERIKQYPRQPCYLDSHWDKIDLTLPCALIIKNQEHLQTGLSPEGHKKKEKEDRLLGVHEAYLINLAIKSEVFVL